MRLFYQPLISQGAYYLTREESRHCIKVLRKHRHDIIELVDGNGNFYQGIITETNPQKVEFEVIKHWQENISQPYIQIAVAPTKRAVRMEWLVEKATEVGVDRISFIHCANSERHHLKLDRLKRKAVSAMKQSLKASLPQLDDLMDISDFVSRLESEVTGYYAHIDIQATPLSEVSPADRSCILIGPEGDFHPHELQMLADRGLTAIGLGPSRLRTETAALAALIIMRHFP